MKQEYSVNFLKPRVVRRRKGLKMAGIVLCAVMLLFMGALTSISFLVRAGITDERGVIDPDTAAFQAESERAFQQNEDLKKDVSRRVDQVLSTVVTAMNEWATTDCIINLIGRYGIKNTEALARELKKESSKIVIDRMIAAIDLRLKHDQRFIERRAQCFDSKGVSHIFQDDQKALDSVFPWQTDAKGALLQEIMAKDTIDILKAAREVDVDPRLLLSILFVEQARVYWTEREFVKSVLKPLGLLSTGSNSSLGTMNIKPNTAKMIEENLLNPQSPYYPGDSYAHLLDFKTNNSDRERIKRLTDYKDHYYSYLYTAVYLKEYETQWAHAGFPIEGRPEILATLFNIGFSHSRPNAEPKVGGSSLTIGNVTYTFGGLAYELYYSGVLADSFPLQ